VRVLDVPSLTWSVLQPSSAAPPARGGHSVRRLLMHASQRIVISGAPITVHTCAAPTFAIVLGTKSGVSCYLLIMASAFTDVAVRIKYRRRSYAGKCTCLAGRMPGDDRRAVSGFWTSRYVLICAALKSGQHT